ncbi:MAG: prolyl oligopeptidase family serine peptidase [Rhizobacter sp.]
MVASRFLLAALLVAAASAVAQELPKAPVRNVEETFFGTKVDDPYRYFENTKDPEVAAWMKAQSDRAHAVLNSIGGRDALLAKIEQYDSSVAARVSGVTRIAGGLWFYEKRGLKDNQLKLYVRHGLKGAETLLVDPDALEKKTGKPHAINWYMPSPDGRHVAYGLSEGGSESATLYVMDVKTRRTVGEPVTRADYGYPDWAPDGRSLRFVRLQELKPGMAETEKYQRPMVWQYRLAAGKPDPKPVLGMDTPGVTMTSVEGPYTQTTHDGRWVIGVVVNGVQRELGVYVAPQAAVAAGKAAWKRVVGYDDAVTAMAYMNDTLYVRTHKDAPRSDVRALDLRAPDFARARVVVPASERVVTGIAAASDALYVEVRDGNVKRLVKVAYAPGAKPVTVPLPVDGSFALNENESNASAADPRLPGVVLDLQGWTRARQVYLVDAKGGVRNTGLQPSGPYDQPADIEATEVTVKSHDGAMVPMSIIHRKGVKLDGTNPTLLYGYGSYGITEEPRFGVWRSAWMDAGGVFAVANPRGTSVFGEEWYRGGFQATKPNTWKDFIACAEYLVAQGYTKPARLGILGGSAGGILVGRAMTERPDLFAAVISGAGALNTLRAEFTANGVTNIPEFGTVKNEAGFKALLEMDTYTHLKDGTPYPAVLLSGGVNDPRVDVWESTKTAARLMAASTSGKPVLLRLDYDAGHGVGSTKRQRFQETADMFAFLLWQMGVPGYAPRH